jgi:hypothetical protein
MLEMWLGRKISLISFKLASMLSNLSDELGPNLF